MYPHDTSIQKTSDRQCPHPKFFLETLKPPSKDLNFQNFLDSSGFEKLKANHEIASAASMQAQKTFRTFTLQIKSNNA